MGVYLDIRDALQTLISGVEVDSEPAFVTVATKPQSDFTGYPSATLIPAQIDSEYATVAQNQRGYTFTLMIHVDKVGDDDDAIDTSLKVVDAVLDALDQSQNLDGVCDFIRAVPVLAWEPDTLLLLPMVEIVAVKAIDIL